MVSVIICLSLSIFNKFISMILCRPPWDGSRRFVARRVLGDGIRQEEITHDNSDEIDDRHDFLGHVASITGHKEVGKLTVSLAFWPVICSIEMCLNRAMSIKHDSFRFPNAKKCQVREICYIRGFCFGDT
jgi:hypothetical protein